MINALLTRFTVTSREVCAQLVGIQREFHVSLQERESKVSQLVDLVYKELDCAQRAIMDLEFFVTL